MSLPVKLSKVHGFDGSVSNGFCKLDIETHVATTGGRIVFSDSTKSREHDIVTLNDYVTGIQSMDASSNHRYLAIGFRTQQPNTEQEICQIALIFVPKKELVRVYTIPKAFQDAKIKRVAFSPCSMYIFTLFEHPSNSIIVFHRESSDHVYVLGNISTEGINDIAFNKSPDQKLTVVGDKGTFFSFDWKDTSSRPDFIPDSFNNNIQDAFNCCCYLSPSYLCIGSRSRLLFIRAGQIEEEISNGPFSDQDIVAVDFIDNNLIVVTSNGVIYRFMNKQPEAQLLEFKHFGLVAFSGIAKTDDARITGFNILDADFKHTYVSTTDNQLVVADLSENVTLEDIPFHERERFDVSPLIAIEMDLEKPKLPIATALHSVYHMNDVVDVASCSRRGIIVTVGQDRRLSVYNYISGEQLMTTLLSGLPISCSLHPTGHYIIIGFNDRVKVFEILLSGLNCIFELAFKKVQSVELSHGGHLLAVTQGTTISLFNFYSQALVGDLRGHTGRVVCLKWSSDDSLLFSTGLDGSLYAWDVRKLTRVLEYLSKASHCTHIKSLNDNSNLFVASSHHSIRQLFNFNVVNEIDLFTKITALGLLETHLLVGRADGTLLLYSLPLNSKTQVVPQTMALSMAAIIEITYVKDYNIVIVTDERGTMWFLELTSIAVTKSVEALPDEILMHHDELIDMTSKIQELTRKIENRKTANAYELRNLQDEKEVDITKMKENLEEEIFVVQREIKQILDTYEERREYWDRELNTLNEDHQLALERLRSSFDELWTESTKRADSLKDEIGSLKIHYEQEQQRLIEGHEKTMRDMRDEYELQLREDLLFQEKFVDDKTMEENAYVEALNQINDDSEIEYQRIRKSLDESLSEKKEQLSRLKAENSMQKKKKKHSEKTLLSQQSDIENMKTQKHKLNNQILQQKKENEKLSKQIEEYNELIQQKETKIYDLKRKNQTLEKHKFVLDFKIKNLKKEIDPKIQEIEKMKNIILNINQDLEKFHFKNFKVFIELKNILDVIKNKHSERQSVSQTTSSLDKTYDYIVLKIHQCSGFLANNDKLMRALESLLHQYESEIGNVIKTEELDDDERMGLLEQQNQVAYLRRSIKSLETDTDVEEKDMKQVNMQMVNNNIALIGEIKQLRDEITNLENQHRFLSLNSKSHALLNILKKEVPDLPELDEKYCAQMDDDIKTLHAEIATFQASIDALNASGQFMLAQQPRALRPISREELAPLR
ncbi:hypothetical protein PCE1_001504 [Barthelona sp. PCE]